MTRCSISMPEDCWAYVDTISAKLHISRSAAVAHVIRDQFQARMVERMDALERDVIMLADLVNELKVAVSKLP